jgi:glycosyltransferase involved in cell wall biosynthesis
LKLSVIVPAYNAQETIGLTLTALVEQDFQGQYEIIVVDDGSSDQTAQVIRSFPRVIYIHQSNAGPAAARNIGAKEAQGQVLAFTDSDCIPHKDWLSKLLNGFVTSDVGVVMGSYGIANDQSRLAWCVYKEILFRHERLLSDFPKVFGSYNFCILKNMFDQVGGFDLSYRNASGEDNDLSYKINSAGYRIYFERKALVDHHHPTQITKYLKEQFRHGFWRVSMYASHPKMISGDGYTFWKDIVEIPWSFCCLLIILLTPFGILGFKELVFYFLSTFLFFEIYFARIMIKNIYYEFFWGFVMFLRSFSRTLGLSTGILYFIGKKILNKP